MCAHSGPSGKGQGETASRARAKPPRRLGAAGFTLIELLVVLVILGLLVGLIGPQVMGYLGGARSEAANAQIRQLSTALDLFMLDVGRYPNDGEGLAALVERPQGAERWNGPYLTKTTLPEDPWGRAYQYRLSEDGARFVIFSLGADNAEGGEGENRDIRSDGS